MQLPRAKDLYANKKMDDDQKILKALNLCYRLITLRMRSEKEIIDYLNKKKKKYQLSDELIKKVVDKLTQISLINDQEFIEWFVRSRINRKQKSDWLIKLELVRHGISKELVDAYFVKNPLDHDALSYQVLASKWDKWRVLPSDIRIKKAYGVLQRRGFSYDIVKKTIAIFEKKD